MNNFSLQSQSDNTTVSATRQAEPLLKLIVFPIGNLTLSLRIESVYKVVNHTAVYSSGVNHVGVAHLGDHEVTVVDLYQRFFQSNLESEASPDGYLVIVKNQTSELYGIPVAETPTLIEVPISTIRVLPESYRRSDTLEVASHVAVIPHQGTQLTIFLLDVNLLLPVFQELKVAN